MGSISINFTDDTQQCIHVIYGEGWDWPEFFATDETAKTMLSSLDHKVDFILEIASAVLPKNVVGQFPKFVRGAASLTHPNSRRVVIVGTNQHMNVLVSVFQSVYPTASKRVFTAKSVDEASRMLAEKLAAEQTDQKN